MMIILVANKKALPILVCIENQYLATVKLHEDFEWRTEPSVRACVAA